MVAADRIAPLGIVSAAVSLHGVNHSVETVTKSKVPLLFLTPIGDPYFSDEKQNEVKAALEQKKRSGGKFESFYGSGSWVCVER